jgi:hypothetical protein
VQFWATFPYGKGFWTSKRLKRETDRFCPGTVVSVDPLRVLWDSTMGGAGPAMEYPLGGKEGYDRSCVRRLPEYAQRHCDNCYYSDDHRDCPPGPTCMNIPGPRNLHKWRPENYDPTI